MSVGTIKREVIIKNGRNRKKRPKTFATKEAALAYKKAHNLEGDVVSLSTTKFKIA